MSDLINNLVDAIDQFEDALFDIHSNPHAIEPVLEDNELMLELH